MSGKFVVGYDGSAASRRALDFAVDRAAAQGGSIVIAHVLEWSPYSFLTPNELEERHARRNEELARAKSSLMDPIAVEYSGKGAEIETTIKYGKIVDVLCSVASETDATQVFVGRDGESSLSSRVFGSVASSLAQCSPVPCTIVP